MADITTQNQSTIPCKTTCMQASKRRIDWLTYTNIQRMMQRGN